MKNPTPPTGTPTLNEARVRGRYAVARALRATSRALVKAGHAWASVTRCAEILGLKGPEYFRQLCVDGDPAIACGDIEALGPRFAIPFYQRRLAELESADGAPRVPLRDAAEQVVEQGAALVAAVRRAEVDGRYELHELDEIDAQTAAAEAHLATVRAKTAALRVKAREAGWP